MIRVFRKKKVMMAKNLCIYLFFMGLVSDLSQASQITSLKREENGFKQCLDEPIGTLKSRMTNQVNTQGSTLGVNINVGWTITPEDIEMLAQTGVGWAQICFRFTPEDRLDWEHNDMLVHQLADHNIQILGHIGGIGRLPVLRKETDEGGTSWANPVINSDAIAAYAMNLTQIVDRYKDKIFYWEIWNEIDNAHFWQPKPNAEEYAELFNLSRNIILAIQPEAKIISGSLTVRYDSPFVEQLIQLGVIEKTDYFGFHPPRHLPEYGDGAYPNREDYDRVIRLLKNINPSIQMWDTEVQALTGTQGSDSRITHATHAKIMLRRYLVEKDLGYYCTLWQLYKAAPAVDHPGQLLTIHSEPTEKYYALQNLGAWLDGNIINVNDKVKVTYSKKTLVLSEEALDRNINRTNGFKCLSDKVLIDNNKFIPSIQNKEFEYVDLYVIQELSQDNLPGLYVLYVDGEAIDYYHGNPKNIDLPENVKVWFRTSGTAGGLYMTLPKNSSLQKKHAELINVEASLRHGNSVKISSSLFRPYAANIETTEYDRYFLKPLPVSPTGISFDVIINGSIWPVAIQSLHGFPIHHVSVVSSLEDLVIITPKNQDIRDYAIELHPPRVDNVYTTVYKNIKTGDIFIAFWQTTYPKQNAQIGKICLCIEGADPLKFSNPVLVDLMNGRIYDVAKLMQIKSNTLFFENLPFVDWPLLITDKDVCIK